jgi:hypothetical protein
MTFRISTFPLIRGFAKNDVAVHVESVGGLEKNNDRK